MNENHVPDNLIFPYTPLYSKDFPIILFWIPKSGCTTLNKWFFYQNKLWDDVKEKSNGEVHGYRNLIYTQRPNYQNDLKIELLHGQKERYKLVRNPYRRAVSSFISTVCSPWLISLFNSEVDKGLSFQQFLSLLKQKGTDIDNVDRHIGPQYIKGEEAFVQNHIKLESFNSDIKKLENKYNLAPSPISNLSKSSHHMSRLMTKEGNYTNKIIKPETFNWFFPTSKSLYNEETIKLVREIYSNDFKIYNYDPEDLNI